MTGQFTCRESYHECPHGGATATQQPRFRNKMHLILTILKDAEINRFGNPCQIRGGLTKTQHEELSFIFEVIDRWGDTRTDWRGRGGVAQVESDGRRRVALKTKPGDEEDPPGFPGFLDPNGGIL